MKKFLSLILILTCCLFTFSACSIFDNLTPKNEMTADFVRFSIGQRQNYDYYLDFTIKFNNQTKYEISLKYSDFLVEINDEQKTTMSILYEYEEVFIGAPSIKSHEEKNLRLRVISNINMGERNKILVKYKNKEIVNDNVTFANTNK